MVWKYQERKKLVHVFGDNGSRPITAIAPYYNGDTNVFMSAGTDGKVKVWSLDKFQLVYEFQVPYAIQQSRFLNNNEKLLLIDTSSHIHIMNMSLIADHYFTPDMQIQSIATHL